MTDWTDETKWILTGPKWEYCKVVFSDDGDWVAYKEIKEGAPITRALFLLDIFNILGIDHWELVLGLPSGDDCTYVYTLKRPLREG